MAKKTSILSLDTQSDRGGGNIGIKVSP